MKTLTPTLPRPQIAIDGIYFQIGNTGIARVWRSLITEWLKSGFAKHLLIIDRGGTAPKFPGLKYHHTPLFNFQNPAAESIIIQEICDRAQIDLFISTYHTIPLNTRSIVLVHDLLPEIFNTDLAQVPWDSKTRIIRTDLAVMPLQEKHWSILQASHYISISQNTARDLQRFFPNIQASDITIALNGISLDFTPQSKLAIQTFKQKYQIDRDYFLIVGHRNSHSKHKNTAHFFRAFAQLPDRERYSIVCVGDSHRLEPELAKLVNRDRVRLISLTDSELMVAYSGAIALIYPSLYEGFGLPILEAMACGCPVITCKNSAIPEVAGDVAIYVSETDVDELTTALIKVQNPQLRTQLISRGFNHSQKFSWTKMAAIIAQSSIAHFDRLQSDSLPAVNPFWVELRKIQVEEYREGLYNIRQQLHDIRQLVAKNRQTKSSPLRLQWIRLKKMLKLILIFWKTTAEMIKNSEE